MTRGRPGRALTAGERAMAAEAFGAALDPDPVRLHRRRWWPLQPRAVVMAPDGHIWFHPESTAWSEDFSRAASSLQGLFVHELTHVWQHQRGLRLPLRRHPFCRYAYRLAEGRPLERYGIEQQAMIVQHGWQRLRAGAAPGAYAALLPALRDQSFQAQ